MTDQYAEEKRILHQCPPLPLSSIFYFFVFFFFFFFLVRSIALLYPSCLTERKKIEHI